jgi:hypothetical protein
MTRLSLNQLLRAIPFAFIYLILSLSANSQTVTLEKSIKIPEFRGKARELVEMVGKEEEIVFSYTNEINLSYDVAFTTSEITLKEFLDTLFNNQSIGYKVIGSKVILFPSDKTEPKPTESKKVLRQTVRGTIYDFDTKIPLIGVTVTIPDSDPIVGTSTDAQGSFRIENVPIGRINLHVSYIGYENIAIPNIEVNSAKEVILNLEMHESSVKLDEVVVKSGKKKGEALNELSLLSSRSISVEETKRYTAGMDDPARMVTSYAGVTASDGGSDIIVRGNSPKYMQWYLDGVEITSPYHMDDQNATVGTLTVLNKSLMGTSDFYTGAFSPEYGNVLSNIMNLRLRTGNNEKFEATLGIGLMGTDLTIEGPFKKGYKGSYLINYRYSTATLINDLGLLGEIDAIVNYQDATFKAVLPTKKAGTFSIFGVGGLSGFAFENLTPGGISTPGLESNASILKDYDKGANLSNLAVTNTKTISENSYVKTSLSYSANGINDDLFEKKMLGTIDGQDITGGRTQIFNSRIRNSAYRAAMTYHSRINSRNRIQIGTRVTHHNSIYRQNLLLDSIGAMVNITDFNKSFQTLNNFISWKFNLNHRLSFVSGLHNMNMFHNSKSTLEPRVALSWMFNENSSLHAGYGKHSRAESLHNYFVKIPEPDGSYTEPNKNLDLLKADHFVLGYQKHFTDLLVAKLEVYYQHLYNLPVENNDTSYYATINEGLDYRYVPLVNKGIGRNYGVEFTLERFFDKDFYLVFNSSLYESKYKSLEGIWRNTRYNGNYIVNLLGGKEFKEMGRKNNNILAINVKALFAGAQRYIPLLRDSEGNVAADPGNNRYWDYDKAYDNELVHVYNLNISISYKINRLKATHEIFLDLMNIVNSDAKLFEYYDDSKPGKVGYGEQMFFLPNIMYRVYF